MILMDTYSLIWLDQDESVLGRSSRKLMDKALQDGDLAVSAITFWEAAMLASNGRISMDITLNRWRLDLIRAGLVEIPIDGEIVLTAAQIDFVLGNDTDRFILATALVNDAVLLTMDMRYLNWPGQLARHDARV